MISHVEKLIQSIHKELQQPQPLLVLSTQTQLTQEKSLTNVLMFKIIFHNENQGSCETLQSYCLAIVFAGENSLIFPNQNIS